MEKDLISADISPSISDDEEDNTKKGFSEAIKEIGGALFRNYEDKTSYLSSDNIVGTIQCDVLNDFMKESYGMRFQSLDNIVALVKSRRQSKEGYGKDKLIEALTKINATFDTIEGDALSKLKRRI